MIDLIIDFDKKPEKHRLYNVLKGLKGKNQVEKNLKWGKISSGKKVSSGEKSQVGMNFKRAKIYREWCTSSHGCSSEGY
jgi:hypothetical protein